MLLFVGLGNPGSRYVGNRHNIGFMAVEDIARLNKAPPWRRRFQGAVTEANIGSEKVLFLLPETFMNESGRAVQEAMQFYKIALKDIIVFHDELDLPPAKMRVKLGGGNAGHNGLRSITAQCGNEYRRVRLGIGHPGHKDAVHGFVLSDFSKSDREWVADVCRAVAEQAQLLVSGQDATFQSKVHLSMDAQGWGEEKEQ
jgi:PTH1 family peptidyl-tRNA hydrolase